MTTQEKELAVKLTNQWYDESKWMFKTDEIYGINILSDLYSLAFSIVEEIDKKTGIIIDSFNGYPEAAQNVGTTKNSIWRACNGVQHTSKGFIWKSELI